MSSKYDSIHELALDTANSLLESRDNYLSFLDTAAENYKYLTIDQLLIYAQYPEATTCASVEFWNKHGRWINKGAKGIALVDGNNRLKYIFDVRDTNSRNNADVKRWQLRDEYLSGVIIALQTDEDLKTSVEQTVVGFIDESLDDYLEALHEVSNIDTEQFYNALSKSSAYMVLKRCGYDSRQLYEVSDFADFAHFTKIEELNILLSAGNAIAKSVLRIIEKSVIEQERERSRNDEDSLQPGRRLSDADAQRRERRIRRMGSNETELSDGAQGAPLFDDVHARDTYEAPQGDRETGNELVRESSREHDESRDADGRAESSESHRVDGQNEQHSAESPRDSNAGDNLFLIPTLPSQEDQIALIDEADSTLVPSAFALDDVLRFGSNTTNSRAHVIDAFQKDKSADEIIEILKRNYYGGYGFQTERGKVSAFYMDDGIALAFGSDAEFNLEAELITWDKAVEHICVMLEKGTFASSNELVNANSVVIEELAQSLIYLKQDLAKGADYLPCLDGLPFSFQDVKDALFGKLPVGNFPNSLESEFAEFMRAYAQDRSILRFHYHKIDRIYNAIQDLVLPLKVYSSTIDELKAPISFITEDEIRHSLSRGSSFEHGKARIYRYFQELHNRQEQADFIKREYGIGGHSHAVSGATHSSEDHDAKGIRLSKGEAPPILLGWVKVASIIEEEIRKDRYLSPTEKNKYAEWLQTQEEKETVGSNRVESKDSLRELLDKQESIVVVPKEYSFKLGDSVYLGLNEYEILSINDDIVELYDKSFPLFPKTMARGDFETQLAENSLNEYLLIDNTRTQQIVEESNILAHTTQYVEKTVETVDSLPQAVELASNYTISEDALGVGTPSERIENNLNAIKLLKKLEAEDRFATSDEQKVLASYVGWGGLASVFEQTHKSYEELKRLLSAEEYSAARESTLTAFFTPPVVIKAMYEAIANMGFKGGNILEPSCGIGNFMGLLPAEMSNSQVFGVELDSVSAGIAKYLYPENRIANTGYERADLPDNFFDLAIGNVPFGQFKLTDKRYDKHNFLIHDYFFAATLDKLRPGGVIAFITSKGTLDKENPSVRKYIAQRAELLGAIRLPNNTFKSAAGTEVTSDIIFLQKRERMVDMNSDWVHTEKSDDGIAMNSYFVSHPEMIVGEMQLVSGPHGLESTCVAKPDEDLASSLSRAIQNIHAEIREYDADALEDSLADYIPADPNVRNFSYTVVENKLYFRENSRMMSVAVSDSSFERIKSLIAVRDCVRTLIEYQTEDYSDEAIIAQQEKLNALYDSFTARYGIINSRSNSSAFSTDSSYPLLSALEILDEDKQFLRKADMFSKRTINRREIVTHVDSAAEALALSMSEKAKIDMEYMSELTDKSEEVLFKELEGVIFLNPDGEPKYLPLDEYLSDNVREKLKQAELLAERDNAYSSNVEALQKVIPKDLDASEISVRLGATWLSPEIIQQFINEFLEPGWWARRKIEVKYVDLSSSWRIEGKNEDTSPKAISTYGSPRKNAYVLLEDALNLRDTKVYDTVIDPATGEKKSVLNKNETQIAQSKQALIKQGFSEWIWQDPERREKLTRLYNDKFNSIRPREYDGSHLTFPGMNPEIKLRQHQLNAVARIIYGGNTLLAHTVGAGKTFTMTAAAQELKRLGLCQKSMFVVPNHLTEQWAAEYLQLYPSANILVATKKDFEAKNRKRFCSRIATGDFDAVIIGHSQFLKIPMSDEWQRQYLEEELNSIMEDLSILKRQRGENFTIKQYEKVKKTLTEKLRKLNDQGKKDDVVTFEELGVDRIFVDEAHLFKNLAVQTKMQNVGGISVNEAQKSSDLYMKCRYLDKVTGGKGTVFATGTPISNSMVEMFTMQRYLQRGALEKLGLRNFDAWASSFGETVTALELAPQGTAYQVKTRFTKFYNLPELIALFKCVADIQTSDMLKLPVPVAHHHTVKLQPSAVQKELVKSFSERAERVHNKMVNSSVDNMLLITNDGRKLALDQRLLGEDIPEAENSKVTACVENVYSIWEETAAKRSTQMIFCDLSTPHNDGTFNVYDDIKRKLLAKGIPQEEIAYIHDADTEAKKTALFGKVRNGSVRILLGSTQKMGAGTNVQQRLIALHHMDTPWRPSDLEQREGRIIRQGNTNPEVDIYTYITENTFDAYSFQLVESKQRYIGQIMTSKSPVRSAEDVDEVALSYAEIKALCAGNPQIKEKMTLDNEVQKLKLLKASFLSEKYRLEDRIYKAFPAKIANLKARIDGLKHDVETVNAHPKDISNAFVGITIKDSFYSEKVVAGKEILELCSHLTDDKPVSIGVYRGFNMELFFDRADRNFAIRLRGETSRTVPLGTDPIGIITRLDNGLSGIAESLPRARMELADTEKQLETAKIEAQKEFPQEAELKAKSTRLSELNILLNMDKQENEIADEEPEIEATKAKCKQDFER